METEIVKEPQPAEPKKEDITPEKQKARLENWFQYGSQLEGNVYEHPRFEDGTYIYTSKVIYINKEIGIAETLNTVYILVGKEKTY